MTIGEIVNRLISLYNRAFRTKTLKLTERELEILMRENKESPARSLEITDSEEPSVFPITALNWKPTGPKGRGVNPGIANGAIGGYETDVINQRYADSAIEESRLHDNN